MLKLPKEFLSPILVSDERRRAVLDELMIGARPSITYYVLLGLATMIAGIGLLTGSTAVVIGAMLVSPLMTPMFGVAIGVTRGDLRLVMNSLVIVFSGTLLCIALAFVLGLMPFALEISAEMISRTRPTLLDLLVAMFAGLAACLTWIDERVSPVLPGVAIATSLVPPLATCGLVLAFGGYWQAWGAFLLFFANFIAIVAVSAVVFVSFGFIRSYERGSRRALVSGAWATAGALVAVAALLTYSLVTTVNDWTLQHHIETIIENNFVDDPNTAVDGVTYRRTKRDGDIFILSTLRTPRVISPVLVRSIEDQLESALGEKVALHVRCVLTRDVAPFGGDRPLLKERIDGTITRSVITGDAVLVTQAERLVREFLAGSPRSTLDDIYMLRLDTGPVVVAEITSTTVPTPTAVATVEARLKEYTGEPTIRLLVRTAQAVDVTAKGKVLFGAAHFGGSDLDYAAMDAIETSARSKLEALGDIFVDDIDVIDAGENWNVRGEVVGVRVLQPRDLAAIERRLATEFGKPVSLSILSRVEVMTTSKKQDSVRGISKRANQPLLEQRDAEFERLQSR